MHVVRQGMHINIYVRKTSRVATSRADMSLVSCVWQIVSKSLSKDVNTELQYGSVKSLYKDLISVCVIWFSDWEIEIA